MRLKTREFYGSKDFLSCKQILFASMLSLSTSVFACNDQTLNPDGSINTVSTCIIFVTKNSYRGDMGGWSGADNKCQSEADTLGHRGTFKALLAWNRSTQKNVRYYRPYDSYNNEQVYIATAAGPNLSRYLTNSIMQSVDTPGSHPIWTGLSYGNSTYSDDRHTCNHWHDYKYKNSWGVTHDNYSGYGQPDQAGYGWDDWRQSKCRDGKYLACVAQ